MPVIASFAERHRVTDRVVVADAGMVSAANLAELDAAGLRFIVGSRSTKAPGDLAPHFRWHGNDFGDGRSSTPSRLEPATQRPTTTRNSRPSRSGSHESSPRCTQRYDHAAGQDHVDDEQQHARVHVTVVAALPGGSPSRRTGSLVGGLVLHVVAGGEDSRGRTGREADGSPLATQLRAGVRIPYRHLRAVVPGRSGLAASGAGPSGPSSPPPLRVPRGLPRALPSSPGPRSLARRAGTGGPPLPRGTLRGRLIRVVRRRAIQGRPWPPAGPVRSTRRRSAPPARATRGRTGSDRRPPSRSCRRPGPPAAGPPTSGTGRPRSPSDRGALPGRYADAAATIGRLSVVVPVEP